MLKSMRILIVEDDAAAARLLRQSVTEAGYTAEMAADGETALRHAQSTPFALILLDVMLPGGKDGFTVCREMRAIPIFTPILILTARDALEDTIAGLDAGADDYLVKPFRIAELLARMRALLRRGNVFHANPEQITIADLILDTSRREAVRAGKTIPLSATEYRLLEHLMRHAGQVVTRSALLDHVWQYDFGGNDNVLDVYISYLRTKIDRGKEMSLIHTVRGVGYRFGADPLTGKQATDDSETGRKGAS